MTSSAIIPPIEAASDTPAPAKPAYIKPGPTTGQKGVSNAPAAVIKKPPAAPSCPPDAILSQISLFFRFLNFVYLNQNHFQELY